MSHNALLWAFEQAPVPNPTAAAVLLSLAWHANQAGTDSYPSVERIQLESRLGATAVRAGLSALEAEGLITRDGLGPNGTAKWSLDLERVRPMPLTREVSLMQQSRRAADRERQQKRRQATTSVTPPDDVTTADVTPPRGVTNPGVTPPDDVTKINLRLCKPAGQADVTPPGGPEGRCAPKATKAEQPTGGAPPPDPRRTADPKAGRPNDALLPDQADGPDANSSPKPDPPPRARRHLRAVS